MQSAERALIHDTPPHLVQSYSGRVTGYRDSLSGGLTARPDRVLYDAPASVVP